MNSLTVAAQTIKDSISALDAGHAMGLEIRRGRCRCPVHGGGDFNCRLYDGDRGYYCFVCHESGDVIKFVQDANRMTFREAVGWLSDTFGLGLDIESPMRPEALREAKERERQRAFRREMDEWVKRTQFDLLLTADQILEKLKEQRDRNAPKTADEPWNPAFCEAIRLIPVARRMIEELDMMCLEGGQREHADRPEQRRGGAGQAGGRRGKA